MLQSPQSRVTHQMTPQQQAQLLSVHLQSNAGAAASPSQDNPLLSTAFVLIRDLAHTVHALSTLPGAAAIISPDTAAVVQGITSQHKPQQLKPQPLTVLAAGGSDSGAAPAAATKQQPPAHLSLDLLSPVALMRDVNNQGLLQDSAAPAFSTQPHHRQQPSTPPALVKSSAQHSPVTPPVNNAAFGAAATPPAATALPQMTPLSRSPVAAVSPSHRPVSLSTDTSSTDSKDGGAAAEGRVLQAQRALAAVMGLRQQQGLLAQQQRTGSMPGSASAAAAAATAAAFPGALPPFGLPLGSLLLPLDLPPFGYMPPPAAAAAVAAEMLLQQQQLPGVPRLKLAGAASLGEIMQAAEILTALHSNNSLGSGPLESPMHSADDCDEEEQAGDGDGDGDALMMMMAEQQQGCSHYYNYRPAAAAAASGGGSRQAAAAAGAGAGGGLKALKVKKRPAKKAAARNKGSSKRSTTPGHKGHKLHFAGEADHLMSEEARQALHRMWVEGGESLPVYIYNKDTHTRTEGTFRIIDGKKKILTADGACLDPVEFEKLADRVLSRNWQMSISITGLNMRPGCKTDVKLGHATRVLGIHYPPQP